MKLNVIYPDKEKDRGLIPPKKSTPPPQGVPIPLHDERKR